MSKQLLGTILVLIGLLMIHPGLAFIGAGLIVIVGGYGELMDREREEREGGRQTKDCPDESQERA